jgi:cation:H+ antiporter
MIASIIANPYFFNIFVILASVFIIAKAADLLVDGISRYAHKLGLSDYIIGFIVVAMAASMPEVISSLMGLAMNEMGVMFGSILGTNMVHMALVVGILVLVGGKKLDIECKLLDKKKLIMWLMLMLPFLLMLDSELSRADGIILVAAFVFYIIMIWRVEGTFGKIKKNVKLKNIWRDMVIFVGALMALILAGRWLVFSSVIIAKNLGIPTYFIALTIIGVGSAIPDFLVGFKSVKKGHTGIGVGDVIGSTVIELILYFGIVAIVHPIKISIIAIWPALLFLVISITVMMWLLSKKIVHLRHGVLLVGIYIAFILFELARVLF